MVFTSTSNLQNLASNRLAEHGECLCTQGSGRHYLQAEVSMARVSDPFAWSVVLTGQISRFGVIPKHHKPDSWQLITDLSHLHDHSILDGIPPLCFLSNISPSMML